LGRESIKKLKGLIDMLEKELKIYSELIDLPTMLPKEKFIKHRLARLINRARTGGDKLIGIFLKIEPQAINEDEKSSVRNYIINYIDSNIRPYDMLFLIEENSSIGLVCIEENPKASETIVKRFNEILDYLKVQVPNNKITDIKWKIRITELKPEDDVNSFLKRLKGE